MGWLRGGWWSRDLAAVFAGVFDCLHILGVQNGSYLPTTNRRSLYQSSVSFTEIELPMISAIHLRGHGMPQGDRKSKTSAFLYQRITFRNSKTRNAQDCLLRSSLSVSVEYRSNSLWMLMLAAKGFVEAHFRAIRLFMHARFL